MTDDIFLQTTDYKSIVLHAHSLRQCIQKMMPEEQAIVSRISSMTTQDFRTLVHMLSLLCKKNLES